MSGKGSNGIFGDLISAKMKTMLGRGADWSAAAARN
jgi:hypothetical protein